MNLPAEVSEKLPAGLESSEGCWLVMPRDRLDSTNEWIRIEDWYPESLRYVIWFGDDGTGNFLGWNSSIESAILWNPEDGDDPIKIGSVQEIWAFVRNGYG